MSTYPFPKTLYPKVKPEPTVDDCLRCLRISDYAQWLGATAGSWSFGFITGRPARFAIANLMAAIGFTFGTFVVLQNTRGRLMGFRENTREQKMYGTVDAKPVKLDWKTFT